MHKWFGAALATAGLMIGASVIDSRLSPISSASAAPSLIGDTVTCTESARSVGGCLFGSEAVVGTSFEFREYSTVFFIDVGASTITLSFTGNFALNLLNARILTIGGLDFSEGGVITGFTLTSQSSITGLAQGDLSFTSSSVSINLQDTVFNPNGTALLTIATRSTAKVPEPGSMALLALVGLGLLTVTRRKASRGH